MGNNDQLYFQLVQLAAKPYELVKIVLVGSVQVFTNDLKEAEILLRLLQADSAPLNKLGRR